MTVQMIVHPRKRSGRMVTERMRDRNSCRGGFEGQGRLFPLIKHPPNVVNVWTNGNYLNKAGERTEERYQNGRL